jgi:hypothetical protein
VPDGQKTSRLEQIRAAAVGTKPKADAKDDSEDDGSIPDNLNVSAQELREIPMPDISEAAGYLVALLHSAGYAAPTGMGLVGLSWQEIEAWARCSDYVRILTPKEYRAVFQLSRAYAGEIATATKKDAKAPYDPPVIEIKDEVVRDIIEEHVEDVFGAMIAAQTRD